MGASYHPIAKLQELSLAIALAASNSAGEDSIIRTACITVLWSRRNAPEIVWYVIPASRQIHIAI